MDIAIRVERLRDHLVKLGERPRQAKAGESEFHTDFSDFSESTVSGQRDPSLTDLADQA
jgi:hypothetical protein